MTSSYKSHLMSEVHLDVEHNVAANLLKSHKVWYLTIVSLFGNAIMNLLCNLDLGHFLVDGPPPVISPHFLIHL